MQGKIAGGLLGLVLCGVVLVTFGFTQEYQEKNLYVVVGSTDGVITRADGKEATKTQIMVGITATADPAAAMQQLTDRLHQKFPPAQGYTNHRIVAIRAVREELLEEVLATKHKPSFQLPFKRDL